MIKTTITFYLPLAFNGLKKSLLETEINFYLPLAFNGLKKSDKIYA